jgi:AraC-like DNA-binding protein
MSSVLYCHATMQAPWGIVMPPLPDCLVFHIVIEGTGIVRVGDTSWELRPGRFALVPHGIGHELAADASAPCVDLFDLDLERVSEHFERLTIHGDGATCSMLCGAVRMTDPVAQRLAKLLPPCIHTDTWQARDADWMHHTLRLLTREAEELRAGGEVMLTRLADVLVIQSIREWLATDPQAGRGWLGALQDPELGPALAAIHSQPTTAWTVALLADQAAMSRSAFAARFSEVLGQTPADYVRQWKMHLAASWLRNGEATVSQAGQRLGYESEAAFSRAFKRVMGMPAKQLKGMAESQQAVSA